MLNIRKACNLLRLYGNSHQIRPDSPEILFMDAVCGGDVKTALSFFRENKQFSGKKSAVDTPYGRFEGLDGIEKFANSWTSSFAARSAAIIPVIQTIANGRVALEAVVNFVADGEINQVPLFVIGDLRGKDALEEVRIYCHCSFVPGLQAYRRPIFQSVYREIGDPGLLTGAVREYYEALHRYPAADVDRVMACIGDNCVFGGYEPWASQDEPSVTRAAIRAKYEKMSNYIPRCVGMRFETIIDDGKTCVLEWVHIVSRAGREELDRIALSGIAAYERDEKGLLCSIRICDYAGLEKTIDWEKIGGKEKAQEINFVEKFPAQVGVKSLM